MDATTALPLPIDFIASTFQTTLWRAGQQLAV
jgi:hypothetical protein